MVAYRHRRIVATSSRGKRGLYKSFLYPQSARIVKARLTAASEQCPNKSEGRRLPRRGRAARKGEKKHFPSAAMNDGMIVM